MCRSITISYRIGDGGPWTDIDVRSPYDLFGTQRTSKEFWSLPIWRELGVVRLSELGTSDPIYFIGWDMMDELANEISIIERNMKAIEYDADIQSTWLAHLVYCYNLLKLSAPEDSVPEFMIG